MRSSTRPSFFALVIGLWIISCAIVLVSVLVAPPARGQVPESGEWSPKEVQPVESAGEIVLTFTSSEPGRIGYWTREDCPTYPWDPQHCRQPMARASEDYGAVKGEWIFTEAGSRTIRIPILDDDLDEANFEAFSVDASSYDDVAEQTRGWYTAYIRIGDDDPKPTSDSSTSLGGSNPQSAGSRASSPTRPASPITSSSSADPADSGNQSGVVNPGGPFLEVEGSAADEAEPIAADTVGEDNFIFMTGLRALALVTIAAAGFALRKKFVRKKT